MGTFTLSGATRIVPILAWPVDHVRAPRIYNPAFAAEDLDWHMVPMGVHPEDLAATVAQLARVSNLQGLNLTIPHKAAAAALCTRLTPAARRSGMVNTMRLDADGAWAGENSDGIGFVSASRTHGLLRIDKPAVIVGAGGAGTAIALSLADAGVRTIDVFDTDATRIANVLAALRQNFPDVDAGSRLASLRHAGLAVNATPLGLHPGDAMPFDAAQLPGDACVFDIIAARDTELMAACTARGLRVLGGGAMIEGQLITQIAFWRGEP
ncbi:ThiF family adenylyltransferase [Variovorax robiniae]|uniref:ThiF family adenylyltransferase n=1 Tax=Variovorax robiniae TaxID=1836199 RepID=A0ABU8XHV0_9BURK